MNNLLHETNDELQSHLNVTLKELNQLKLEYELVVEKCKEYKEEKDIAMVHYF